MYWLTERLVLLGQVLGDGAAERDTERERHRERERKRERERERKKERERERGRKVLVFSRCLKKYFWIFMSLNMDIYSWIFTCGYSWPFGSHKSVDISGYFKSSTKWMAQHKT